MACDSFLTFAPKVAGGDILQMSSATSFAADMVNIVGMYDCATGQIILDSLIPDPSLGLVPDGYVLNLSDISIGDVTSPDGTQINLTVNAVNYGYWESQGGIWIDHTTYGPTFVFGPGNVANILTDYFVGGAIAANLSNAAIGGDLPGYLGCVVPSCGVSPPVSDPVHFVPPGIKLVNFSRFVNPFGIKGRF